MTKIETSKAKTSPELKHCLKVLLSILKRHIRLFDLLIGILVGHPGCIRTRKEKKSIEPNMISALTPMLQTLGSSSHTLASLSDSPGLHTRDCYSIARSIVEAAINICYILAEGSSAAEQAIKHARQKSYRDLQRESKIGDSMIKLAFSGTPDSSSIDGLEEDIDEFTSRGGREKGWIELSVDDRIALSGKVFGHSVLKSLHIARFAVYRHSSEILHGTLFGSLYFLGVTEPSHPTSIDGFSESIGQKHMLVLMATNLAVSAIVEAFHQRYGYAMAYKESKDLLGEIQNIPYLCQKEE